MYRALYDYNSPSKEYLTFIAGDEFTLLGERRGDWLLAQNGFGEVGFIPSNYIKQDESAALSEIIKSIDRAMQAIHYAATSTGSYTHEQRENLKQLAQHRDHVLKNSKPSKKTVPTVQAEQIHSEQRRRSVRRAAPPPPTRTSQLSSTIIPSDSTSSYPSVQTDSQYCSSSSVLSEDMDHGNRNHVILSGEPEVLELQEPSRRGNDTISGRTRDAYAMDFKSDVKIEPTKYNEDHLEHVDSPLENSYVVISSDKEQNTAIEKTENKPVPQRTIPTVDCQQTYSKSPAKSLPSPTSNLQLSPSKFLKSPSIINFESITVPDKMASDMVEQLREHTGLSYPKSCLAVEIVLGQVAARLPQLASVMDKVLMTFSEGESKDEESSYDGKTLQELLTKLTECKDDAQQRSWSLFEDQQTITDYLEEILSILENAKSSVCRKVLAKNRYEALHNLVEYYQMETRISLRMLLLKCFGAMCGLEASIVSNLLYSILPLELVSEIQNKHENVPLVSYVAIVLSMILSTGEPLPTSLSDYINETFIGLLFDLVENPPSPEFEDDATDQLVIVLLALNLHYTDYGSNPIMAVLAEKGTVKTFTEKLLILFNRGDDPVKMFDFQTSQQNSVMKFVTDLYRDKPTSSLLYTNDAKVLVDIIIRQLRDLQPGDEVRTNNLVLANVLVENSNYLEYRHRESELCRCLHNILHEESTMTMEDKTIVSDILDKIQDFT